MWYLLLIAAVIAEISCDGPLSQQFINEINQKATTWYAGRNFHEDVDFGYIRKLMGVHPESIHNLLPDTYIPDAGFAEDDLPEVFDARRKWHDCPTINEIRNSGGCGACWASAAVEAMSDRVCIHSNAKTNFRFSSQHLISCCHSCGYGCNGGFPGSAWSYWARKGLVSGGSFGSKNGCLPYEFEPCEHHKNSTLKVCDGAEEKISKCPSECSNPDYGVAFNDDVYVGKSSYAVERSSWQIQMDIFKNGPSEAVFTVYEDFLHYRSGIYQHVAGNVIGDHAVRIIGWGVDNDVLYWLIANSWNNDWGDHGFFKILRGEDHLGIESQVSAGLP